MYCVNVTQDERRLLSKAKVKALEDDESLRSISDGKVIKIALKKYLE